MYDLNIFRSLHHVCIVVCDIDKSVGFYESIGVGPWGDYPPMGPYEVDGVDKEAFLTLKYKYANIDNVQIQLCEPGVGDTAQKRFLDERGEGVFHLGFSVPDCDAAEVSADDAGLAVKMRGRLPDRGGFTYFETSALGAGVTLEVRARGLLK